VAPATPSPSERRLARTGKDVRALTILIRQVVGLLRQLVCLTGWLVVLTATVTLLIQPTWHPDA
jgi:hypothetical protein